MLCYVILYYIILYYIILYYIILYYIILYYIILYYIILYYIILYYIISGKINKLRVEIKESLKTACSRKQKIYDMSRTLLEKAT